MTANLIEFKAGKLSREGVTNTVNPDLRKGTFYMNVQGDDLLHLYWKERTAPEPEDDLIIFPEDATFERVSECTTGRVYVLKFLSSAARHFFWLQSAVDTHDEARTRRVNALISDPNAEEQQQETQTEQAPSQMDDVQPTNDPSADQEEHEQEQQRQSAQSQLQENLRNILSQHAVQSSEPSSLDHEPLALEDVLTPDIISPLFEDPRLREIFFEHLPEETPKTEASIRSVTSTPYFRNAIRTLSHALSTGQAAPLLQQIGLPEDSQVGVEAFLQALARQYRENNR